VTAATLSALPEAQHRVFRPDLNVPPLYVSVWNRDDNALTERDGRRHRLDVRVQGKGARVPVPESFLAKEGY
jgi:hypothetical protein